MWTETYAFALVFGGISRFTPEMLEALHKAGLDDAKVVIRNGAPQLQFEWTAKSYKEAVDAATKSVQEAIPEVQIVRVERESAEWARSG